MSAASNAAAAGAIIGIVTIFLAQQLSYLYFGDLVTALTYLIVGVIVGVVVFGLIGWTLGKRYRRRHGNETLQEWKAPPKSS